MKCGTGPNAEAWVHFRPLGNEEIHIDRKKDDSLRVMLVDDVTLPRQVDGNFRTGYMGVLEPTKALDEIS